MTAPLRQISSPREPVPTGLFLSFNEIEAEVKKAARGVGLPWGLAEEAGKAVRWLAAHGVDALPALVDVLDHHDSARITIRIFVAPEGRWTADGPLCPITLGAALSDHADRLANGATIVAGPVLRPLLVLPFLARASRQQSRPLRLSWQGCDLVFGPENGLPDLCGCEATEVATITAAVAATATRRGSDTRWAAPLRTDAALWERVSAYGHRTYVPASEASRARGAGAGQIDND